ncbi:MAG: multidrug effflux MFS transporter [Dysgonamonadaceae bacterium]|jgi:DHA1 family bicyclomycin/chloramphenicol resistance-like MFS transporter|nr:multidrug effflux MFS transporter [Dysgonamonadaceae bacterium]
MIHNDTKVQQTSHEINRKNSKFYLLVTLSGMTAFAPLVTDMYLPALPVLTGYFKTSVSMVQFTISTSMLGIALGQLFFGSVSDKMGRRQPLFISFVLYLLATGGCLLSPNIHTLIFFRLLQGLGAAGSIVIARSVASDWFTGKELLKFLALITAVQGIAPIAAPVAGGILLLLTNWKGIFLFLGILGLIVWAISLYLKESLPVHKRAKGSVYTSIKLFAPVFRNKPLILYIALLSFSMAIMFAYIASSPFIFQEHYNVSSIEYSLIFAINAVALTIGNLVAARFKNPQKTLNYAVLCLLAFSMLTGISLLFDIPLILLCISLFLTLLCAGATFPISTNLALDLEKKYKGTASAVLGASSFLVGSIVMPLSGLGNILHSTCGVMVGCAAFAAITLFFANKNNQ